jgi:hypothetical protein
MSRNHGGHKRHLAGATDGQHAIEIGGPGASRLQRRIDAGECSLHEGLRHTLHIGLYERHIEVNASGARRTTQAAFCCRRRAWAGGLTASSVVFAPKARVVRLAARLSGQIGALGGAAKAVREQSYP